MVSRQQQTETLGSHKQMIIQITYHIFSKEGIKEIIKQIKKNVISQVSFDKRGSQETQNNKQRITICNMLCENFS